MIRDIGDVVMALAGLVAIAVVIHICRAWNPKESGND
jgi:hypothetical protein